MHVCRCACVCVCVCDSVCTTYKQNSEENIFRELLTISDWVLHEDKVARVWIISPDRFSFDACWGQQNKFKTQHIITVYSCYGRHVSRHRATLHVIYYGYEINMNCGNLVIQETNKSS